MGYKDCCKDGGMGAEKEFDVREFIEAVAEVDGWSTDYSRLIEKELAELGITALISTGNQRLGKVRVIGKGWSSVVIAAKTPWGPAAVKVMRYKSRRRTLLREALLATIAAWLNISPQVYAFTRHIIVYQLVKGVPIAAYNPPSRHHAILVVRRLLWKAYLLDRIGISHNELARPDEQVLVETTTAEPYIIDYESATLPPSPSNLTQLVGGLHRVPWLRNIMLNLLPELRLLLKQYKNKKELELYDKVLGKILIALQDYKPSTVEGTLAEAS